MTDVGRKIEALAPAAAVKTPLPRQMSRAGIQNPLTKLHIIAALSCDIPDRGGRVEGE